jgi:hypothetical protein
MTLDLTRRSALAGLGLAAAAGLPMARAVAAAAASASTASPPADLFARFLRLRSAPGHAPVAWISDGLLFVKPEGAHPRALVRSTSLAYTQIVPRADGTLGFRLEEVGFYRDAATGAKLVRWTNPMTGREVTPPHYRTPEDYTLHPDGPRPVRVSPGIEIRSELVALAEHAGDVCIGEDLYVRIPARDAIPAADGRPPRPARPERFLASLGSYTVRAADLAKPASQWVDCALAYSTLNSVSDWLGLGDFRGVQNLRLMSRKRPYEDLDSVPAWLRENIARDHPTFLELPKQWAKETTR